MADKTYTPATVPKGVPSSAKKGSGHDLTLPDNEAMEVLERWKHGTAAMTQELFDYYLNFHFIDGQQWIWWNTEQRRLDQVPRDPERVRLTINRMKANSRTIMGKLMQRPLAFEVLPTDADDSHVRGAKLGESLLENVRIQHRWEEMREMAYWATWKAGTCAIAVMWDAEAEDPTQSPEDTGNVQRAKGDTREKVYNLSQFTTEPGTDDAELARYWITLDLLPPKEAQAKYQLSEEPPADGNTATTPFLLKLNDKQTGNAMTPLTQVFTMYERPSYLNKKGCVRVVIDSKCVFDDAWPYPWKDHLNMVIMRETKMENRWSGSTIVTDARPIQTAFNQSWSNIVEHMKRAGNARLAMPQSAVDMMEDLSDLPGEIMPYPDGQVAPEWKSPPQMPQWWVDQPGKLAQELDDVMSVHPISRGDAPQNIESGYGLSILAEHDATPTERLLNETQMAFSKLATMVLKLYEEEVGDKRKSIVSVPGQPARTLSWSGDDFRGQTTAIVPQDQIIPRSRAALMETGKEMVKMGFISNMADFAFFTEMPSSRMLLEGLNPDIARARRENAGFAVGRQAVPREWDDHEVHIIEHHRYCKSVDFDLQPPEEQAVIEAHIQAHVTMQAEKIAKQQTAGAIGGPGLAGAPTTAGPAAPPELNPPNTGVPVPPGPPPPAGPPSIGAMGAILPGQEPAPAAGGGANQEQIFNALLQQMNNPSQQAPK
jgi:hypothetical protein